MEAKRHRSRSFHSAVCSSAHRFGVLCALIQAFGSGVGTPTPNLSFISLFYHGPVSVELLHIVILSLDPPLLSASPTSFLILQHLFCQGPVTPPRDVILRCSLLSSPLPQSQLCCSALSSHPQTSPLTAHTLPEVVTCGVTWESPLPSLSSPFL